MHFGKYSVQNEVCSFDYSTSVRLIKTDTDKTFEFLLFNVCPIDSLLRSRYYRALQRIDMLQSTFNIAGKRSEGQS